MPKESKHTEASFSPISTIHCAYVLLRCLDLEMWQFCADDRRQRRQTKLIALPLAHAHGITTSFYGNIFGAVVIHSLCNCHIQVLWKAVNGMLPKNLLRKKRMQRLHLFPNDVSFIIEQIAKCSAYWLLVYCRNIHMVQTFTKF